MNHLDQQIEAVSAILRAAGGRIWIDPDAPEEIKREFLRRVRECPDCRALVMTGRPTHPA